MKVLHCPTDTGGHPWGLSRAERELGIDSDVMVYKAQWYGYPNDIDLHFERGNKVGKAWRAARFFAHALRHYDVFHFNWGSSLLDFPPWGIHLADLPLLKRSGKKIIVTFQGTDARPRAAIPRREAGVPLDTTRRLRIDKMASYADKLFVLNPDLQQYVPDAECLPYASVDPRLWKPGPSRAGGEPVRVVHLPTNRAIKGTEHVIAACRQLTSSGTPLDLQLVEGVPHQRIPEILAGADIVIDQLLVGWYGGVAVEAMAMARPVLCYLNPADLRRFAGIARDIPIVNVTPESLSSALAALVADPKRRRAVGEASRRYVEAVHDPLAIACRVIECYEGRSISRD